ncbi:MAG: carboxypeptidase-like regulatory domain-containing protein [Ferruginibacter sp.]|nr:carboxypeptidase-like regulatory domain-containing protein [Ferruginibacter sp.]
MAQSRVFSGSVKDEKDNPVSFASILIKGTKSGVSADANGRFSIRLGTFPAVLVINAAGYLSMEKNIRNDSLTDLTIILKAGMAELKEVVVTSAYGIKRTARSVSSSVSVSGALAGKVGSVEVRSESSVTSSTSGQNRTKLLTAGELSDFKKWKLWEGYNNSEFRSYSDKWKLYANARYTVQLQNINYKAVTGQVVYLINGSNGDTLWTAVSDNTGKAELWDNFGADADDDNEQLEIAVKGEANNYPAKKFENGINFITLKKECRVSSRVDIAFVVDATGSMGDEIDYLKEELEDILIKVSAKDASIDLRTGAVFYRDTRDEYVTRVQPFTSGITQTTDFIKKQAAGGGGDYPEAVKEALEAATEKLNWSPDARTKIIFLVMDAPPHDEAKATLSALIRNAAAKGIRIVPLACSGTDKSTEFVLRSIALATNGTYIFLTDDSGIGNKHIKPTTDEFKVELLNDLLQRTIAQMCYVNTCEKNGLTEQPLSLYKPVDSVKVYPNPATGPVTLETELKLKEVYVADFTGKILRSIDIKKLKTRYRFDISDLPAATYFIRYTTEDNKSGAEKLLLLR